MPEIVKTYPGVGDGLWLDLVRVQPGKYNVQVAETGQVIAEGFILPTHAEEWVVDLQAKQRQMVRSMIPTVVIT